MTRLPRGHYTPEQLADLLCVPPATVKAWRHRGGGPPYYRIGKHVRYDPSDVAAWLAAHRVTD